MINGIENKSLITNVDKGINAITTGRLEYDTLHHYILSLFEPEKLYEEHITMVRFFSVLPSDDISITYLKILWRVSETEEKSLTIIWTT